MKTLIALLSLSTLFGCSTLKEPEIKYVTRTEIVYQSPPDEFITIAEVPKFDGKSWLEVAKFAEQLKSIIRLQNINMQSIKDWKKQAKMPMQQQQ